MKSAVKWIALVLILSGWVAFIARHATAGKEKALLNSKISQLESELDSYQFLVKDVETSAKKIDDMISILENLKTNLDKLKSKMDKGVKNESSQNGE
ncbi:hypothetical protein M0P98_00605 [bacterium]|nr:hypothetical protein [bacterium]